MSLGESSAGHAVRSELHECTRLIYLARSDRDDSLEKLALRNVVGPTDGQGYQRHGFGRTNGQGWKTVRGVGDAVAALAVLGICFSVVCGCLAVETSVRNDDQLIGVKRTARTAPDSMKTTAQTLAEGSHLKVILQREETCETVETPIVHRRRLTTRTLRKSVFAQALGLFGGIALISGGYTYWDADNLAADSMRKDPQSPTSAGGYRELGVGMGIGGAAMVVAAGVNAFRARDTEDDQGVVRIAPRVQTTSCHQRVGAGLTVAVQGPSGVRVEGRSDDEGTAVLDLGVFTRKDLEREAKWAIYQTDGNEQATLAAYVDDQVHEMIRHKLVSILDAKDANMRRQAARPETRQLLNDAMDLAQRDKADLAMVKLNAALASGAASDPVLEPKLSEVTAAIYATPSYKRRELPDWVNPLTSSANQLVNVLDRFTQAVDTGYSVMAIEKLWPVVLEEQRRFCEVIAAMKRAVPEKLVPSAIDLAVLSWALRKGDREGGAMRVILTQFIDRPADKCQWLQLAESGAAPTITNISGVRGGSRSGGSPRRMRGREK